MPVIRKPEARKLRKMSRQSMLALPAWVLRRLAVSAGAPVYFHRHRAGEVVLSAKEHRGPGRAGRHDLEEELAQVIAERDEMKRGWAALTTGDERSRAAQVYMQALRVMLPIEARLDVLTAAVEALAAGISQLPGARQRRARRARTADASAPAGPCRVCGEPWAAHPKPGHAWDTPPSAGTASPKGDVLP
jgi:hypothetical protein